MGEQNGRRPDAARSGGAAPGYTVRVSARAQRVRLVVSVDRGLEVVVPRRFDRRRIAELVESKRGWIEKATARIDAKRGRLESDPPRLPDRIVLPAIDEEWAVEYSAGRVAVVGVTVRERGGRRLLVCGNVADAAATKDALCRWLSRKAKRTLVPRLAELSRQHRLDCGNVVVRQQRTRWGSCSRRKTISLNARLLFLAPALVDYVLIHELCHTVEMNHSPRFWTRLGYHDPKCRAHRRLLRRAGESLPTWLDNEVGEPGV